MADALQLAEGLVESARRVAGLPSLFASFIDNAAEAWVIVSSDGKIALFNRKAVLLFGWRPEHVIGQPVEMLLPKGLRARHAAVHRAGYLHDPYTRAMGANLDLLALHRDGSTFPVLIDLHPEMSDDGLFVRAAIRRKQVPGALDPIADIEPLTCPFSIPPPSPPEE